MYIDVSSAMLWNKLNAFFNYGAASGWQVRRLRMTETFLTDYQIAAVCRHLRDLPNLHTIIYPNNYSFLSQNMHHSFAALTQGASAQSLCEVGHVHDDLIIHRRLFNAAGLIHYYSILGPAGEVRELISYFCTDPEGADCRLVIDSMRTLNLFGVSFGRHYWIDRVTHLDIHIKQYGSLVGISTAWFSILQLKLILQNIRAVRIHITQVEQWSKMDDFESDQQIANSVNTNMLTLIRAPYGSRADDNNLDPNEGAWKGTFAK
ncbi:hypothetical protein AAVH_29347 [Aphelenchoides avenae]|nr:hypothetical protein AAVH_29347 [Aphelenchus avenae]